MFDTHSYEAMEEDEATKDRLVTFRFGSFPLTFSFLLLIHFCFSRMETQKIDFSSFSFSCFLSLLGFFQLFFLPLFIGGQSFDSSSDDSLLPMTLVVMEMRQEFERRMKAFLSSLPTSFFLS